MRDDGVSGTGPACRRGQAGNLPWPKRKRILKPNHRPPDVLCLLDDGLNLQGGRFLSQMHPYVRYKISFVDECSNETHSLTKFFVLLGILK